jgi:hypothetical protein
MMLPRSLEHAGKDGTAAPAPVRLSSIVRRTSLVSRNAFVEQLACLQVPCSFAARQQAGRLVGVGAQPRRTPSPPPQGQAKGHPKGAATAAGARCAARKAVTLTCLVQTRRVAAAASRPGVWPGGSAVRVRAGFERSGLWQGKWSAGGCVRARSSTDVARAPRPQPRSIFPDYTLTPSGLQYKARRLPACPVLLLCAFTVRG